MLPIMIALEPRGTSAYPLHGPISADFRPISAGFGEFPIDFGGFRPLFPFSGHVLSEWILDGFFKF